MNELRTAHTSDLDAAALRAARELLEGVFAGDFDEHDWEHALGGVHALVWEDGELVGHASVIQRRLLHGGRALRTGYVEGVGVRADRRRRGHGAAAMAALERVIRGAYDLGALGSTDGAALMGALGRVIRGAYELGALGATDEATALYAAAGWRPWEGPSCALTPEGIVRTEDEDGSIWVLEVDVALDRSGTLTCDWRDGSVW